MSLGTLTILLTVLVAAAFAALGIAYSTRSRIDAEGFLVSRNWAGGWIATATLVASVMGPVLLASSAMGSARPLRCSRSCSLGRA